MNIIEHPFFETKVEHKSKIKPLELPESQKAFSKTLPIHKHITKPFFQPRYATDITFYDPVESKHSNSHYESKVKPKSSNTIWWILGLILLSFIGYSLWNHLVEKKGGRLD